MDFEPLRNSIICRQIIPEKEKIVEAGLEFESENFPLYLVVKIGSEVQNKGILLGDIIALNSKPDLLSKDEKLYLVKEDSVSAVVE